MAIRAISAEDLTLLIRTPSGEFVCNDELERTDFVSLASAQAGQYTVWVGPQVDRARAALVPVTLTPVGILDFRASGDMADHARPAAG